MVSVYLRNWIALASLACAGAVHAADESSLLISGFGTLGVVHSDSDTSDFVLSNMRKPSGAGHTKAWSPAVDSNLGLQAAYKQGPWSAVVQVVSSQNWDKTYTPGVEWANVQYAITPDFSVRAGRIVLPTYMQTETGKVGYANTLVRPPVEAYSDFPVYVNDGVDATWRQDIGSASNSITVHYGWAEEKGASGYKNKITGAVGIVDNLDYGPLRLHAGYLQFDLEAQVIAAVIDRVPQLPQGQRNALKSSLVKSEAKVFSLGAAYDPGDWIVAAEVNQIKQVLLGKRRGWYVYGGYRLGQFTPYLAYAQQKQVDPPSQFYPLGASAQKTTSLGVRWDFYRNMDLKLQFDSIRPSSNTAGTFISYPGNKPGTKTNLFSVTLDFVF